MFVLIRTLTYASIFTGIFLVLMPERILAEMGMTAPASSGLVQSVALIIAVLGSIIAIWSILSFAFIGRGTPAPFDPPRRLVVRGPYRYVRNPMYIGAILVLSGITVYLASFTLLFYTVVFWGITHLFVVFYEESVLKRKFEKDYNSYKAAVNRWWPKI